MLVAEKRNYLENYDYQRELKYQQNYHKQPSTAPVPEPKPVNRVIPILAVMVVFCLAAGVVARYARISENHHEILRLQNTLENEYNVYDELQVKYASMENFMHIEMVAKDSMGMNYPGEGQIKYVELPREELPADTRVADNAERSFWSRIIALID